MKNTCLLYTSIDDKFVENEIINEPDIEVIKRKRLDFLLDKFRTEDETYKRLLYEQEQMQREIAAAEEKVRQFSGIVNAYEKEKNDRQNGKQEIQIENEKLKSRIRPVSYTHLCRIVELASSSLTAKQGHSA